MSLNYTISYIVYIPYIFINFPTKVYLYIYKKTENQNYKTYVEITQYTNKNIITTAIVLILKHITFIANNKYS